MTTRKQEIIRLATAMAAEVAKRSGTFENYLESVIFVLTNAEAKEVRQVFKGMPSGSCWIHAADRWLHSA